jgi:uncharacterized protein
MTGESNLDMLLKSMRPVLHDGEYVFCVVDDLVRISPGDIMMLFKEKEGVTIIVEKSVAARSGLSCSAVFSWISLTVHSSLEAVGLTAAFSRALANEGISCNVVAGYHHDHIFVPLNDSDRAIMALNRLAGG